MTKVHPKSTGTAVSDAVGSVKAATLVGSGEEELEETEVLTVWRKSMLLNGNGFTVFDGKGDLVFRVDNYASENKGEIVLMDAAGKPLLTIRRKKLSLGDHWLIYDGEETSNPRFSVKKQINLLQSKSLAHINHCSSSSSKPGSGSRGNSPCSSPKYTNNYNGGSPSSSSSSPSSSPRWAGSGSSSASIAFDVQGSYNQRYCTIYDDTRRQMAEIKRKESNIGAGVSFGLDVFHLVVQPGFDAAIAMAIVILLEQMFGAKSSLLIKA